MVFGDLQNVDYEALRLGRVWTVKQSEIESGDENGNGSNIRGGADEASIGTAMMMHVGADKKPAPWPGISRRISHLQRRCISMPGFIEPAPSRR